MTLTQILILWREKPPRAAKPITNASEYLATVEAEQAAFVAAEEAWFSA